MLDTLDAKYAQNVSTYQNVAFLLLLACSCSSSGGPTHLNHWLSQQVHLRLRDGSGGHQAHLKKIIFFAYTHVDLTCCLCPSRRSE